MIADTISAALNAANTVGADTPRSLAIGVASMAGRQERFDHLPGDADTIKSYVRAFAERVA